MLHNMFSNFIFMRGFLLEKEITPGFFSHWRFQIELFKKNVVMVEFHSHCSELFGNDAFINFRPVLSVLFTTQSVGNL